MFLICLYECYGLSDYVCLADCGGMVPSVSHVKPASTSLTRPVRPTLLTVNPAMPFLFLSSRLPEISNNPGGVTGTPNVDKGDAHVNYRRKKLEQLSVQ